MTLKEEIERILDFYKVDYPKIVSLSELVQLLSDTDEVNWYDVSESRSLSEDFIWIFQNKVKWYHISINQILSEDFIREFQNQVDWFSINKHQNLSTSFREEFQDRL